MQVGPRRAGIGIGAAAAFAAAFVLLAGGATGAPTGSLTPKDCVDDNDFGNDNCDDETDGMSAAREVVASADGRSVYVASEQDDAIAIFKRNTSTGALKPKGCVDDDDNGTDPSQGEDDCAQSTDGLAGAGAMAVSKDGKSLYAVGELDDAVVRFERNTDTGALTPQGCVDDNDTGTDPGQGEDDCAQSTDGLSAVSAIALSSGDKSLYTASEGDDAIVRFSRDTSSGALTPQGCVDDNDTGTDPSQGADSCAQSTDGLDGATGLAITRNGESLYASTEHDGAVVSFSRDTSDGALTPQGCIEDNDFGPDACAQNTPGLESPEGIAVSRKGKSLYVAAEASNTLVRFNRDTETGALTSKGCVEDKQDGVDGCADQAQGLSQPAGIALSDDGSSLYVASADDNAVTAFKRSDKGALDPLGCVEDNDTGGGKCDRKTNGLGAPEDVTVTRNGESVYALGEDDNAVVHLQRAG